MVSMNAKSKCKTQCVLLVTGAVQHQSLSDYRNPLSDMSIPISANKTCGILDFVLYLIKNYLFFVGHNMI